MALLQWKLGDPLLYPDFHQTSFKVDQLSGPGVYRLMTEVIVPRPIAFVSTVSAQGIPNLAPYSFFNGVSSHPPTLMIAIAHREGGEKKDTLLNLEQVGEFVVNGVDPWLAGPMNLCSADYPYGVNEMEKVGLTALSSLCVRPPRVKESSMHLECRVEKTVLIGDAHEGASTLVIGRILAMHLSESFYQGGKVIPGAYTPLARLGGAFYGICEPSLEMPRPVLTQTEG